MGLAKLQLRPGFNSQATQTLSEGGWFSCNLVRWKNGLLEKIGGWVRLFSTQCAGLVRAMHAFEDLQTNLNLVLGTDGGLQVASGGVVYNVSFSVTTDIAARYDSAPAPGSIACTALSTTYTVTDADFHPALGTSVVFPITFSAGGVTFIGPTTVTVASLPSPSTWTFTGPAAVNTQAGPYPPIFLTAAGSSIVRVGLPENGTNYPLVVGNSFVIQQQVVPDVSTETINVPPGSYVITTVYAQTLIDIQTNITQTDSARGLEGVGPRLYPVIYAPSFVTTAQPNWFLDNLGQDVTINYTDSGLYVWTPPVSTSATAGLVTTAPQINSGTFVAMPQAQVISFGSEAVIGGGVQDPLLLRFSDAGSYTDWTASATNQAGSYRLSRGSRIVGGIQAPQTTLIWTDTDLWSMSYVGPPFVYSFTIVGTGCGLISPKARATIGRDTYWMSKNAIWKFGEGGVQQVPCDAWDIVFNDLDTDNVNKCNAGPNSSFSEFFFFFPSLSGGTGDCDSYVKVNVSGQVPLWDWAVNTLVRTAWIDNNVFGNPLGADGNRRIQQHERGYDNDTVAMSGVYAETGFADIGEGDDLMLVKQVIPDFKWFGEDGSVNIKLKTKNYPGDQYQVYGPQSVTNTTQFAPFWARARSIAMRFEWAAKLGFSARLGSPRVRGQPAGRNP